MVSRRFVAAAFVIMAFIAGKTSVARADQVDNPLYKAWASFNVGSNKTLEGTISVNGFDIKTQFTSTLKEVTADHVTVEIVSSTTINGQSHDSPARSQAISAKTDDADFKSVGEEDVQAMGKTFKCKVWTASKDSEGTAGGGHGEAKIWSTDEVPGGVVKLEGEGQRPGGQSAKITYLITKFEAK